MGVRILPFGGSARLFELEAGGIRAAVTDFGAALVALYHPDGTNVVLGFDDVTGYRADSQFVGVIVGRYANRIARGRFILDGQTWTLPCNDGANHLHGGPDGFGRRVWTAEVDAKDTAVQFSITSPHLDQGYPGAVVATALYRLDNDGRLVLTLSATADRPTIVNLAPHAYFNLAGSGDIRGHHLRLNASRYTPVDDSLIPTGRSRNSGRQSFRFSCPASVSAGHRPELCDRRQSEGIARCCDGHTRGLATTPDCPRHGARRSNLRREIPGGRRALPGARRFLYRAAIFSRRAEPVGLRGTADR